VVAGNPGGVRRKILESIGGAEVERSVGRLLFRSTRAREVMAGLLMVDALPISSRSLLSPLLLAIPVCVLVPRCECARAMVCMRVW
jgi:hypothetical protein